MFTGNLCSNALLYHISEIRSRDVDFLCRAVVSLYVDIVFLKIWKYFPFEALPLSDIRIYSNTSLPLEKTIGGVWQAGTPSSFPSAGCPGTRPWRAGLQLHPCSNCLLAKLRSLPLPSPILALFQLLSFQYFHPARGREGQNGFENTTLLSALLSRTLATR